MYGESRPPQKQFLALAAENFISSPIGTYEPEKGWVPAADRYIPYQQESVFTLYGIGKVLAVVKGSELFRRPKHEPPAFWATGISTWTASGEPYALAVAGERTLEEDPGENLVLNDPTLADLARKALAQVHLDVPQPYITQAFSVRLDATQKATLICAHSDTQELKDDAATPVYAIAFVQIEGQPKAKILTRQVAYKPKAQSVAQHEQYYGTRDFLRFVSAIDIDGDGRKEVVVYVAKRGTTQMQVFSFNGKRFNKVLESFNHYDLK